MQAALPDHLPHRTRAAPKHRKAKVNVAHESDGRKRVNNFGHHYEYEWKSVRLRGPIILDIFSINPQHALGRQHLGSLNRKQISSKNEQSEDLSLFLTRLQGS